MILTLVEKDLEGAAVDVSLEALTFAAQLSAEGGGVPVDAVVVDGVGDELRKELGAYGVRHVYVVGGDAVAAYSGAGWACLLYTSPSPRDGLLSRMPSSA